MEPEVMRRPTADSQAIGGVKSGLPVVAICDANLGLRNVDQHFPLTTRAADRWPWSTGY